MKVSFTYNLTTFQIAFPSLQIRENQRVSKNIFFAFRDKIHPSIGSFILIEFTSKVSGSLTSFFVKKDLNPSFSNSGKS